MATIELSSDYGYVILTFILSAIVNFWHGGQVLKARKKYNVVYPAEYQIDVKDGKIDQNNVFNCYQRSHQNFLENYAMVMGWMFIGGLKFPIYAAGAGVAFLAGRVIYALGYSTGNPKNRLWGEPFLIIGMLGLLGLCGATGLSLLGWVKI